MSKYKELYNNGDGNARTLLKSVNTALVVSAAANRIH